MSNVLNRKARREKDKKLRNSGINNVDILQLKKEITEQTIEKTTNRMNKVMISALLIAMNTELGIGPARAEKVIRKMDKLIADNEADELKKQAEKILKIEFK